MATTITKWVTDNTHTQIQFKAKHLMITTVTGNFTGFEGKMEIEGDDFTSARISFSADAASISTGTEQRDTHLRSADFFDVENHPKILFSSTSVKKLDSGNYELKGDLTIRGVAKPVTLQVEYVGKMKDPWGNLKAAFLINGKINRKDWGLNWNAALEAGGVLVSDEVRIECEAQMVQEA